MKKPHAMLLLLLLLAVDLPVNAQYRVKREMYNPARYKYKKGDGVPPVLYIIPSFAMPGLGQVCAGEPLRGLAFYGAFAGCATLMVSGILLSYDYRSHNNNSSLPAIMAAGGLVGSLTVQIWSMVDAVQVAKVHKLERRDRKRTARAKISPSLIGAEAGVVPALSLHIGF
jgi:hypothetical protein